MSDVHIGDPITLVVDVPRATTSVQFHIKTDGGEPIASLDGTIASAAATARADWVVDVEGRTLPLKLVFEAVSGRTSITSGTLDVVPAPPVVAPVKLSGGGIIPIDAQSRWVSVVVGDTVTIATTITSDAPADVDFFVDDVDSSDFTKQGRQLQAIGNLRGVRGAVSKPWTVGALGVPVARVRVVVSRGGQAIEVRQSTVLSMFDAVDITLDEPDFVASIAREGVARAQVEVDTSQLPTIIAAHPNPAWSGVTARILDDKSQMVGAAAFDPSGNGRALYLHGAAGRVMQVRTTNVVWQAVRKGATTSTLETPVTPRAQHKLTLSSRLRLSMWADPALFQKPMLNPDHGKISGAPKYIGSGEFTDGALSNAAARGTPIDYLDDFTLLNSFTIHPTQRDSVALTPMVGRDPQQFFARVVDAVHKRQVQIFAGYKDIIKRSFQESAFLTWLNDPARTPSEVRKLAEDVDNFFADLHYDGLDFDIEHQPRTESWPVPLRHNIKIFFEHLAGLLYDRSMILSVAGTTFTSHTRVQDTVPATGSATALPFTLAALWPNLLIRPMAYDNAFLGNQLRSFHQRVVQFALSQPMAGAGVHPSQFQLGVKIFPGTNNGPKKPAFQGYMTGMPNELISTCISVLRPNRVGLITFSWGVQPPGEAPNWSNIRKFDEALNPVDPIDTPADATAPEGLARFAGAQRFARPVVGQPLQGALDQVALDRLKVAGK